ncbi:hypothetical protein BgiMline_023846 [Biomphalaria glabrata]|nr:hypothetical protein BgiMline_007079 [Biomphalaria glabrata]
MPVAKATESERPIILRSVTSGDLGIRSSTTLSDAFSVSRTSGLPSRDSGTQSDLSSSLQVPVVITPYGITRRELNRYCSARFRSSVPDFPEAFKVNSKVRLTAYLPVNLSVDEISRCEFQVSHLIDSQQGRARSLAEPYYLFFYNNVSLGTIARLLRIHF